MKMFCFTPLGLAQLHFVGQNIVCVCVCVCVCEHKYRNADTFVLLV